MGKSVAIVSPASSTAAVAPQPSAPVAMMRQWAKRLLAMLVMWVVAGVVSAVMTGTFELPSWLTGGTEHEKDVGVHALSDASAPRLSDVGGMEAAKQEMVYNLVIPLKNPAVFFGGKPSLQAGRGILLFGPPGTGKTLLARAAARESGASFIAPTLAQLEAKYYGETAKILQATFAVARKRAPSVIFFDEIDGMMRTRTSDEGCTYGLKTEMLRMLDTLKPEEAVMVIACTNNAAILDPALKRRLNVIVKVELPTLEERADILRICCSDDAVSGAALATIASATEGFTGSDLYTVFKTASSIRMRTHLRGEMEHVDRLIETMPPLTPHQWDEAIRRVRDDKHSSSVQAVGGIGSASDTLRDLVQSISRAKTDSRASGRREEEEEEEERESPPPS